MSNQNYGDMPREELEKQATKTERDVACFRELAEHIPEVFWMTNPRGTEQIYISPAYERIYGATCASLYEQPVQRLNCVHPDDRERVQQAFDDKALLGDYDETYRIVRPDNETRWLRDRAFPVYNDEGEPYRLAGFAIDISAQQSREDERQKQHHQMSALNRLTALGMLGAGLAHEISQPLTAARGFLWRATKLAGKLPDEHSKLREPLDRATSEVERASNTVSKLREYVRFGSPSGEHCDFGKMIAATIDLFEVKARFAGVRVNVSPELLNLDIAADALFCQRILLNLMDNSLEVCIERGIENPTISMDMAAQTEESVTLAYHDNAGGLEKKCQERLFEPFYTSKSSGLGLGLATSRSMAEALGGSLSLGNEPVPNGSFMLRLPLA